MAQATGIAANKRILVNDRMETNIPNIYAAGDVAEHNGRMYGIWPAAQRQGVIAGINMGGGNESYASLKIRYWKRISTSKACKG